MSKKENPESKTKKAEDVGKVVVIPRDAWGALPAKSKVPLKNPAREIIYTDTDTKTCSSKKECVEIVKGLQKYHMKLKGLPDIEHNFLIGGDGNVYEGLGWDTQSSSTAKSKHGADDSPAEALLVAFIGSFKEGEIPNDMKEAAENLISYGIENDLVFVNEEDFASESEADGGTVDRESILIKDEEDTNVKR